MDPKLLYESPFKDIAPSGLEQMFSIERTDQLFDVINRNNVSAGESVASRYTFTNWGIM